MLKPNGALAQPSQLSSLPLKDSDFFRWLPLLSYPRQTISLFLTPASVTASPLYTDSYRCGIIVAAVQCVNFTAAAGTNNYFSASLPSFLPSSLRAGHCTKRDCRQQFNLSALTKCRPSVAHQLLFLNPTFLEAPCKTNSL